jgi:lipopolysaccharide/colanic/teichoic acid biosynthesis glycosyltransferase
MNFADKKPVAAVPIPAQPRELGSLARTIASQPVVEAVSPVVLAGLVRPAEFIGIAAIGGATYAGLVYRNQDFTFAYAVAILLVSAAAVLTFQAFEIYNVAAFRTHVHQLSRLTLAWTLVFLLAFAVSFFGKLDVLYSRVWAAVWFASGLAGLYVGRLALTAVVRRWARNGRLVRQVVVVGGGREGESLLQALGSEADSDVRVLGVFDDRTGDRSPPVVAGVPKLGTVDDLIQFIRLTRVDLVLVAMPLTAEERVLEMVRKLWVLPVDVRLAAHMNRLRFRPRAYSYLGNVPVLDIFDKPIAHWNRVMKTLFDRVAGTLILLAVAPVMAATAIAIKLDSPGPVFFRQRRHEHADPDARRVVTKGDPRVTSVGRFIRKTSLDELPQLVNVLRGELSLVGPRPHAVEAPTANRLWEEVVDGYFARHRGADRLGADQWLARRARHAAEAAAPSRARSLLHRELVAVVRPLHSDAHALRPDEDRERLLMAALTRPGCRKPAVGLPPRPWSPPPHSQPV